MRGKILYGIMLILALFLFVSTNVQITLFFLVPMILVVPLAMLENRLVAKKCKIQVSVNNKENDVNGRIEMVISVKNSSFFPVFHLCIKGEVKNVLTRTEQVLDWETSVPPKGARRKIFQLESRYCGKIESEIVAAVSHDFLGISKCRADYQSVGECYVYPSDSANVDAPINRHLHDEMNRQNRYLNRKGNDITEILDIRDYQKGDNIKSIHWKLSKKMGKKMIRELDMPANQDTILFLVISSEELENPWIRNNVASTGIRASTEFLMEQIHHDALLFSEEGNILGKYSIEGQETKDWYEHILLDGNISFDQKYVDYYIQNNNVMGKYSSVVVVSDSKLDMANEYPNIIQVVAQ